MSDFFEKKPRLYSVTQFSNSKQRARKTKSSIRRWFGIIISWWTTHSVWDFLRRVNWFTHLLYRIRSFRNDVLCTTLNYSYWRVSVEPRGTAVRPQISPIFTDSVSTGSNAIASVPPVRMFPLYIFRTDWPLTLIFCMCVWITTMAHSWLRLKVTGQGQDAVGLTSILDRGHAVFF